jgi:pimeloyl-ACP methyl ester carboxylesterase
MEAADAAELEALDRGDFDGASWHNVEFWVDGPHRSADDVDAELREKVFAMQRQAFSWENPKAVGSWLVSDRHLRLGEIAAPTLIVTGELDQPDIAGIAAVLEDQIPDARWESIAGVAHLPPMEAPDRFADLVVTFLSG